MNYLLKAVKYLAIGIYAMCGAALLLFAVPQSGWKALTVLTGSMRPAINPGALVFVHRVPNHDLRVGDVITYINPRNTKQTITHRITEVKTDQGLPAFITKGDANETADPQILGGNVVGKVVFHLPYVGRVVNWTKTPLGLLLLLGIPALFIIWDEIRVLKKSLAKAENPHNETGERDSYVPAPHVPERPVALAQSQAHRPQSTPQRPQAAHPRPQAQSAPTDQPDQRQPRPKRRGMDGIIRFVAVLVLITMTIGSTHALVKSNSVTLTGNTLSVAATINHLLINRVYIGGVPVSACPTTGTQINLGSTGPGSINQINISINCNIAITNSNTVVINNINHQYSSTGSANTAGNTNGGSSTAGSSSNNNSTNTNVNITGGGVGLSSDWVELYNPTASAVSVVNWQVADNSGLVKFLNTSIPSHGFLIIAGPLGGNLSGAGDRVSLKSSSFALIDAVSWGTDATAFTPSVAAFTAGQAITRKVLGLDTNAASDWQLAL